VRAPFLRHSVRHILSSLSSDAFLHPVKTMSITKSAKVDAKVYFLDLKYLVLRGLEHGSSALKCCAHLQQ